MRACPDRMGSTPDERESNSEQAPSDNVPNNGEGEEANSATGEGEISSAEVSTPHNAPDEPAEEGASQAEPESADISQISGAVGNDYLTDEMDAEDESSQLEAEDEPKVFKDPPKIRKRTQSDESAKSKKWKSARGQNTPTIESDLESDCSVDCSLLKSGYTTQDYTVEDIKKKF